MATIETKIDGMRLTVTVAGLEPIVVNADTLPDNVKAYAMMHGLKQKICDAAALSRDTESGQPATPHAKHGAMTAIFSNLLAGLWNKPSEGGVAGGGVLLRALCQLSGKAVDVVRAGLDATIQRTMTENAGMSEGKARATVYAAMRANPKVADAVRRIEAEDAKTSGASARVDTDAMLESLTG